MAGTNRNLSAPVIYTDEEDFFKKRTELITRFDEFFAGLPHTRVGAGREHAVYRKDGLVLKAPYPLYPNRDCIFDTRQETIRLLKELNPDWASKFRSFIARNRRHQLLNVIEMPYAKYELTQDELMLVAQYVYVRFGRVFADLSAHGNVRKFSPEPITHIDRHNYCQLLIVDPNHAFLLRADHHQNPYSPRSKRAWDGTQDGYENNFWRREVHEFNHPSSSYARALMFLDRRLGKEHILQKWLAKGVMLQFDALIIQKRMKPYQPNSNPPGTAETRLLLEILTVTSKQSERFQTLDTLMDIKSRANPEALCSGIACIQRVIKLSDAQFQRILDHPNIATMAYLLNQKKFRPDGANPREFYIKLLQNLHLSTANNIQLLTQLKSFGGIIAITTESFDYLLSNTDALIDACTRLQAPQTVSINGTSKPSIKASDYIKGNEIKQILLAESGSDIPIPHRLTQLTLIAAIKIGAEKDTHAIKRNVAKSMLFYLQEPRTRQELTTVVACIDRIYSKHEKFFRSRGCTKKLPDAYNWADVFMRTVKQDLYPSDHGALQHHVLKSDDKYFQARSTRFLTTDHWKKFFKGKSDDWCENHCPLADPVYRGLLNLPIPTPPQTATPWATAGHPVSHSGLRWRAGYTSVPSQEG